MPIRNPTPVDALPVNGILGRGISSDWAFDHAALPTAHQDAPALIATHAADLDAHTYNWGQVLRTGEYHEPWPTFVMATVAIVADNMRAYPLWIPRNITVDRVATQVTANAAAGKLCRLGLYNDDGANLYPGTLNADFGTVLIDAIAVVAITVNKALTKGLYWLAMLANDTATYEQFAPTYSPLGHSATGFGSWQGCWNVAQAFGALPDPFTAGGTLIGSGSTVCLRLLSLD